MGFDQYHEPANELPAETRTFARMIASLTEEAEAIGWYEQRLAVEPNQEARAIMATVGSDMGTAALGFDADRATATSPELARFQVVHFATHGWLDNLHPELSGLACEVRQGKDNSINFNLE